MGGGTMEELLTQAEILTITSTDGLRRSLDPNEIRYITIRRAKGRESLADQCRAGDMTFEELGRRLTLPTCDLCWDDQGRRWVSPRTGPKWYKSSKHPHCDSCGIFFGGTHAGGEPPISCSPWGVCRECVKRNNAKTLMGVR